MEKKIETYLEDINNYYSNNKLINNINQTNVMLITNDQNIKDNTININDNIIKHSKTIKVLGTTFSEKLTWEDHLAKNMFISNMSTQTEEKCNTKITKECIKRFHPSVLQLYFLIKT